MGPVGRASILGVDVLVRHDGVRNKRRPKVVGVGSKVLSGNRVTVLQYHARAIEVETTCRQ